MGLKFGDAKADELFGFDGDVVGIDIGSGEWLAIARGCVAKCICESV